MEIKHLIIKAMLVGRYLSYPYKSVHHTPLKTGKIPIYGKSPIVYEYQNFILYNPQTPTIAELDEITDLFPASRMGNPSGWLVYEVVWR